MSNEPEKRRRKSNKRPERLMRYFLTEADDNRESDAPLPEHVQKYAAVRERSLILPWRCWTGCAGEWTDRHSYEFSKCSRCGAPRPDDQPA